MIAPPKSKLRPKSSTHSTGADSTIAVNAFMLALDHPFKSEIEAIRKLILGAHPSITEGIKWNAPSFRTTEYFATIHLRAKEGVAIIFHLGAKFKDNSTGGTLIDDPAKLLKWLANERAMAAFTDMNDVRAKKAALETIVRHWITHI